MSAEEPTVYLEDLETTSSSKRAKSSVAASGASDSQSSQTSSTGGKRQRTIMDMFSPSNSQDPSPSSSKKLKLSASTTVRVSATVQARTGPVKLNAIPFSLSAFQSTLSEEELELLRLECESMGNSWLKVLKDEIKKPYFIKLKKFLWEEGVRGVTPTDAPVQQIVYPPAKDIYSWSNTPLGKIKVVIIGQDPYHGANQAHGLSFSVPHGISIPPSLRNIFAELKAEYPEFVSPNHGNLNAWAKGSNGVLLLNTCLTVRAKSPGSHSNHGWELFTDTVVDVIDRYGGANLPASGSGAGKETGFGRGVVFLAWGKWAAQRVAKLDTTKHLILQSAHPSPYSANQGFLGNGHFRKANEWLEERYGAKGVVDWCSVGVAEEEED